MPRDFRNRPTLTLPHPETSDRTAWMSRRPLARLPAVIERFRTLEVDFARLGADEGRARCSQAAGMRKVIARAADIRVLDQARHGVLRMLPPGAGS